MIPIVDGLYHPFVVISEMVYYCFNHITLIKYDFPASKACYVLRAACPQEQPARFQKLQFSSLFEDLHKMDFPVQPP